MEHPNITQLKAHSQEFTKKIHKLSEILYVAVGYDVGNCSMIVGSEGVLIIDSLRSLDAAEELAADFRKITDKPVMGLIYTHAHVDHVGGASAFVGPDTKVIARSNHGEDMDVTSPVWPAIGKRSALMFGSFLPEDVCYNRGAFGYAIPNGRRDEGYVKPNLTFDDRLDINIGGLELEIYGTKGETDDHLFVWLPNEKIIVSGDNYYRAFPNLYTVRGTRYRDVEEWGNAAAKMATFPAEYLVPGHCTPVAGKAQVHQALTEYAEGILSIYQQTIDAINEGLTIDEVVEKVKLPEHLKGVYSLKEFYGHVEWSVRNIFVGKLGWFDGNPTSLFPLPPLEKAQKMIDLAGSEKALWEKANKAFEAGEFQWCLELTDYLLRVLPTDTGYQMLKMKALRAYADTMINANARNYMLVAASAMESDKVKNYKVRYSGGM